MVNKIVTLLEAVYAAHLDAQPGERWAPKYGSTFCNEAVNFIAKACGWQGFDLPDTPNKNDALLANRITAELAADTKNWLEVSPEVAQTHANTGALVIAAQAEAGHGHVCVVIPGVVQESGQWGELAPRVMNVGRDVFIGKKASFAFHTVPKFYVLVSSL